MGWGRLDDGYPHHTKLLAAGPDALALDIAGICYANRCGTDGWVPDVMLPALYPPLKRPRKAADRLVEVGRWERADDGWWIHDFADYNFSAAEAAERKAKRAEAGRKGGKASKPASKSEATASGFASDMLEAKRNPEPDPVPEPKDLTPPSGPPQKPKPRRNPATTLPDTWQPNSQHRDLAASERVDLHREATKFRDHAKEKDRRVADWDAAFRNWLRRAKEYGAANSGGNGARTPSGLLVSAVLARKPADWAGSDDEWVNHVELS